MKRSLLSIAIATVLLFTAFLVGILVNIKELLGEQLFVRDRTELYLRARFDIAYEREPPIIAIWEGTNLVKFLERNVNNVGITRDEEIASRLFLEARLSVLFKEMGDAAKARHHAERALHWYQCIKNDETVTPDQVVENALARDRLKRSHTLTSK